MSLLEQHFDVAFAAPDGIKKLRELILTLAMQGKLVPQDPNDEPASELLKEIEAEKKRLVKEGVLKNSKPLLAVQSDELPYELPIGWQWARLGNCMLKITDGTHHSPINTESGDFLYISAKNIKDDGILLRNASYVTKEIHEEIFSRCDPEYGNILYIKDGATTGIVTINNLEEPFSMLSSVALLKQPKQVDNHYLLFTLRSPFFYNEMRSGMTGVAITRVTLKKLNDAIIPLPPLAEQRRIVAKIDQLMARCDELEKLRIDRSQRLLTVHIAALDRLLTAKDSSEFSTAWSFITQHFGELYSVKENVVELRKTILQLAVMGKLVRQDPNDEPVDLLLARILIEQKQLKSGKLKESQLQPLEYSIPKHWKWQCLDSILVSGPTNGFSPQAVDYETPVRSLTLSATTSGKFKGEHSKFIANEIPPDSNLWLRDGDILVQRGNTLEYVGVSAVYRGEPNCFIYPDLMMKLRISAEIDTNFIYLVMSSEPCRNFLRSRASGTSGTMPKINQTTLKSLPIPLPPLAEQRRIVEKIDRLMGMCDRLEGSIESGKGKQTDLLNALISQV
jgi:type I restriction enzyme, S subunit